MLTVVLLADAPAGQALDIGEGPVLMFAKEVRLEPDDVIVAEGDVEILRGERRLLADSVRYNQRTDQIEALGNITLVEPGGEVLYADRILFSGDLRNGVASQLRGRLQDDSLLAAEGGRRIDGTRTEMDHVVYSPCPLCENSDDPPLWQITAEEVSHDLETRDVTYRNAFLEMFGVPVAYLPYFSHPDPAVERRTGFLPPIFGSDSNLGFTLETPYYFDLAPNYDLTVSPIFTTNENAVLTANYRHLLESGRFNLGGSITYATKAGTQSDPNPSGQAFRGNIEGEGDFSLPDHWGWGYDLAVASDDTYLDRYDFSDADVLQNRLFAERIWSRNYAVVEGYGFQGLREEDDQGMIPIALPQAQLELTSQPLLWDSRVGLNSSALVLTRTDGLDTRRLSTGVSWELPKQGPIGDLYKLTLSARGDFYNTDGDPETFSSEGGSNDEGRFVPRATLDWSWPLLGEGFGLSSIVEPIVSGTWSTTGNNPSSIPNEDSQDVEFDDTNLFKPSRFPGIDRVEGGGKISYGLRYGLFGDDRETVSALFGQLYKFSDDPDIPGESGFEGRGFSDYVGRIEVRPTSWLGLRYRFRLDQDSASLLRNEVGANVAIPWLRLDAQYLFLKDDPDDPDVDAREEVIAEAELQATSWLALEGQLRRNLEDDRWVSYRVGLSYIHPCLEVFVGMQRKFTDDRDADADTSVAVRLEFKNLGAVGLEEGL
ncbi:MAG TPA: LPS assembly protein LptD [Geminicoccaceae bacterium]|nr:LPS assembly protein LptD [Geminicoccaceae bacterium]